MRRLVRQVLISTLMLATITTVSFAKEKSLYDRLGGKTAIVAVVDEFQQHGGRRG